MQSLISRLASSPVREALPMKTSGKERNHILDRLPGLLLMLCAWSSSVKLFQRTCPLLSVSVFVVSLICFEVDLWLASFHGESDCNIMFTRSFSSKDRAGKSARSSKKKYSEQEKVKLQESLDETSLGKSVYRYFYIIRDNNFFANTL